LYAFSFFIEKKSELKLDIILPFHQVNRHLMDAILSLLESSHSEFNLFMIDDRIDTSKDDSHLDQIIDSRVKFLRNSNHGYGNAINLGIANTNSDFVALMNSDDVTHPNRFAAQIEIAVREKADVVSTKMLKFRAGRKIPQRAGLFHSLQFNNMQLFFGSYSANASCLFRRSWLTSVSPFLNCDMSDYVFALRNYANTKVVHIDKEYYFYRQHPEQQTRIERKVPYELYSLWNENSLKLGLPTLSDSLINLLAIPSLNTKVSTDVSLELKEWLVGFKQLLVRDLEPERIIEYERIIFRRLLAGARTNFSLSPVLIEQARIELIWGESIRLLEETFDRSLHTQSYLMR
jgi:glycosyltransferase involved in cell wall biosynthesis